MMTKKRALICLAPSLIPFIAILVAAIYDMTHNYGTLNYLNALFVAAIIGGSMSLIVFYVCYTYKPPKPKPISEEMKVLLEEHPELVALDEFLAYMAMMSFTYSLGVFIGSGGNMCPWGFVPLWLHYKMLLVLLLFYSYALGGTLFSAHYARIIVSDRMRILQAILIVVIFLVFLIAFMEVSSEIGEYEDAFSYGGAAALSLLIFSIGIVVATTYLSSKIKKIKRAIASRISQSTSSEESDASAPGRRP